MIQEETPQPTQPKIKLSDLLLTSGYVMFIMFLYTYNA